MINLTNLVNLMVLFVQDLTNLPGALDGIGPCDGLVGQGQRLQRGAQVIV